MIAVIHDRMEGWRLHAVPVVDVGDDPVAVIAQRVIEAASPDARPLE